MAQGIDLDPLPWKSNLMLLPALLLRSTHVGVISMGTRYNPIGKGWRNRRPIVERLWFKYVLRANIEAMV